jgi:cholesterol oxidase
VAVATRSRKKVTVGAAPVDYDVLVVGSGFGGSVTALRLTE